MAKVGDRFWVGHGLMNGRDVDDASTGPCETESEALRAIKLEWLNFLVDSQRKNAEIHARQYEVLEIDRDGMAVHSVTVD